MEEIVGVEVNAEAEVMDGETDDCELDIVVTALLSVVDACGDKEVEIVGGGKDSPFVGVDDSGNVIMDADPDINPEGRDDDIESELVGTKVPLVPPVVALVAETVEVASLERLYSRGSTNRRQSGVSGRSRCSLGMLLGPSTFIFSSQDGDIRRICC